MRPVVIIDMQHGFRDCYTDDTIEGCRREIKEAVLRQDWVFFIQYRTYRGTDKRLTELVYDYDRKKRVWKNQNNGAVELLLKLINLGVVKLKPTLDLTEWIFEWHRHVYDCRPESRSKMREIFRQFKQAVMFAPDELRICGVNLSCCVEETCGGLWPCLPSDITLVADAVHEEGNEEYLESGLSNWKNFGNQRIEWPSRASNKKRR